MGANSVGTIIQAVMQLVQSLAQIFVQYKTAEKAATTEAGRAVTPDVARATDDAESKQAEKTLANDLAKTNYAKSIDELRLQNPDSARLVDNHIDLVKEAGKDASRVTVNELRTVAKGNAGLTKALKSDSSTKGLIGSDGINHNLTPEERESIILVADKYYDKNSAETKRERLLSEVIDLSSGSEKRSGSTDAGRTDFDKLSEYMNNFGVEDQGFANSIQSMTKSLNGIIKDAKDVKEGKTSSSSTGSLQSPPENKFANAKSIEALEKKRDEILANAAKLQGQGTVLFTRDTASSNTFVNPTGQNVNLAG